MMSELDITVTSLPRIIDKHGAYINDRHLQSMAPKEWSHSVSHIQARLDLLLDTATSGPEEESLSMILVLLLMAEQQSGSQASNAGSTL